LSTSFHYFIQDNFSLGVNGSVYTGFTAYNEANDELGRYSARIFMLGPKVRYYLGNGKTKVWLKGSASMGLLNVWWNRKKDNNPVKLSQIGGGAGASIFLSRHVSVDLGIEYNQFTVKTNERMKNISTNLALDIGFGIFF
jgi:opacity protein-like surface antigen